MRRHRSGDRAFARPPRLETGGWSRVRRPARGSVAWFPPGADELARCYGCSGALMAIGPSCSDLWTRKPKHGEWEGGEGNGPGGPSVPGVRIRLRAEASGAEHPRTFADEPSDRLVPAMCLYPSVHPRSEHHLTRPTPKRSNGSVPNQNFFENENAFIFSILPRNEPLSRSRPGGPMVRAEDRLRSALTVGEIARPHRAPQRWRRPL